MKKYSAIALLLIIAVSVSVMWVTAKWATTIPEVAACALAAVWALAFAAGLERPRLSVILLPLSGVILWAAVQIFTGISVYLFQTWIAILYWTGNFATFFVARQAFTRKNVRDGFLQSLVLFGFIVSVVSALQALTSNGKIFWIFPTVFAGWNLLGPFVYHNQFAAFVELLLPIALYYALLDPARRAFYVLIAATMYAAVIIAASRTGFVLATAELIAIPTLMVRNTRLPGRIVAGAALVLAAMILLLGLAAGPDVLAGRFAIHDPYAVRREFVYSSIAMFRDRPLTGFGVGNWPTAYPAYAIFDNGLFANQAHNDWAQWTVEGGLPLLALMLWFAVLAIRRGVASVWGIGVAAIFLHCLVDYPIQRTAVAVVFFVIAGAADAAASPDADHGH